MGTDEIDGATPLGLVAIDKPIDKFTNVAIDFGRAVANNVGLKLECEFIRVD